MVKLQKTIKKPIYGITNTEQVEKSITFINKKIIWKTNYFFQRIWMEKAKDNQDSYHNSFTCKTESNLMKDFTAEK